MLDKNVIKHMFRNRFKQLPKEFKLILFRNPKEFLDFKLEKVNPIHKINIWGLPKKQYRKDNTNKLYKVGKIIINSFIPFMPIGILKISLADVNLFEYIFYAYISYMSFNIGMFLGENTHDRLLFSDAKRFFYRSWRYICQ